MQKVNTLYSLQLLRFIAAILVLLFHLELMKSGYKGVDIFFVISGFVMYYTTFILKPKSAISFIINRLTKIYFLYWMAMLLLYFVVPYKINFTTLKTFLLIPGHASLLGVSWSLSYELYFYFLFSITIYLLSGNYYKFIFLFLFVISFASTLLNTTHLNVKGTFFNFLVGQNLWEFLLGISAALIFNKYYTKINPRIAAVFVFIGLFAFIGINIQYMNPYSYIVYGLLAFFIILCIATFEYQTPINRRLSGPFELLGDSSYAIYLFGPVIAGFIIPNNFRSKVYVILLTIIFSILINQLIENNLLRIIRRNLKTSIRFITNKNK